MSGQDIIKWADEAMFEAAPIKRGPAGRIVPQVYLLSATPDPLGAVAACVRMYAGKPTYDLDDDLTNDDRRWAWEESLNTYNKTPWEFIDLHFFIEAVTRSFTHQMVRQRTAVYAQESLRFAVKQGFASETVLPPSIVKTDEGPGKIWADTVKMIEDAYEALVNAGIPAEDARGLLPHCVTTRLNYKTNFRGLVEQAGTRLCTQAQFEWRAVFLGIMKAIKEYRPQWPAVDRTGWQFELLARPVAETFTPVCYKARRCPYMGDLDRKCTIRTRVNDGKFDEIDPAEWMADPTAGRRAE